MKKVKMVFKGVANGKSFFKSADGKTYSYAGQFSKRVKGEVALVTQDACYTLSSIQWATPVNQN